ncbi:hypothetical protein, partial [Escherichia coli]|uniref:hypothetical protein n=1 Tax=Escherichia coli TaxID=562 RepID=UPI0026E3F1BA
GAHDYRDGTTLADWAEPGPCNILIDGPYDPALFNRGPTDLTKLPHRGLGKWINLPPTASLVPSTYAEEGFKPVAPGLGA